MSSNYNPVKDLRQAETMVNGLAAYVRGNELYGQTGGMFSNSPALTVGALLMRLRRLDNLRMHLTDGQKKTLDNVLDQHAQVRDEWAMHYEKKLRREAKSRLEAMKSFFKECADSMKACAGAYPTELLRRTIAQEAVRGLRRFNGVDTELQELLTHADSTLRGYVSPADFQWSEMLETIYPESEFWWLYHAPLEDE